MSGQEKILVAEDEMILALNICRRLEHMGYEIIGPVDTADKAINAATEHEPDLVLMDIGLGDHSAGIEAVKEITRDKEIPVVYITALSDSETLERAKETSPYGYLRKPVGDNDIGFTVEMALNRHKKQLEDVEKAAKRKYLEEISNDIRTRLIRESPPDLVRILELMGRTVRADRAYICLYPEENGGRTSEWKIIEWFNDDRDSSLSNARVDSGMFGSWWNSKIASGEPVIYPDIKELPKDAQYEKNQFIKANVKSLVAFPFRSSETGSFGFIGLDWISKSYSCSDPERNMLSMVSELISSNVVRSKAEENLRVSESRFRTLIQKSSDTIAIVDSDHRFLFMSPSVKKILGYDVREMVGEDAFSYIHKEDLPHVREVFQKILDKPENELTTEYRFLHKKGHWVYLDSVGTNLTKDPVIGGIVINSRDITDHKRVEQELIRARDAAEEMNRVKTTLLANMSHEMRTPLTGILGFASILESDLPDGEARDMAVRIYLSGRRLLETIESILDLAKLEAEKLEIQLENVDIIHEITQGMEVHMQSARHKGLAFEIRTELDELYMDIDRQIFNRIMYNLISNAFKYTEEGKITLYISTLKKSKKHWVQIDVEDTGVGISPDFLPHVFDEFQQESTGLSRKFEGTGLGLTITRKLVDALGGFITVNSKKGAGSIFTMRFPLRKEDSREDYVTGRKKNAEREQTPRILIVEDDFDSSVIAKFYLGKEYNVEAVDSGEKALERLENEKFHMVVLDINLGAGMDGVTTLKTIRSNSQWSGMPVIALTAHALEGDAEYYLSQGFSGYLSKPFKKEELLDIAGELLKP